MTYRETRNRLAALQQRVDQQQPVRQQRFILGGESQPIGDGCQPGDTVQVLGGNDPGLYRIDDQGEAQLVRAD